MYMPPSTRSENSNDAFELMDRNPFATVISMPSSAGAPSSELPLPFISHLPLTVLNGPADSSFILIGHCARANPHWRHFSSGPATAIFQGAHAYITPKWYEQNDVPTWNYSVVHAIGRVELVEDYSGLLDSLKILSKHAERLWPSGWDFFLPEDLSSPDVVMKSIVGFKIHVEKFSYKKKLGQRLSPASRQGVIDGLATRGDDQSLGVRAAMLALSPAKTN